MFTFWSGIGVGAIGVLVLQFAWKNLGTILGLFRKK